jgi:uncharacterized protein YqeY
MLSEGEKPVGLTQKIHEEMVQATKARDRERLSALRMIRSAFQNREIEKRGPLSDEEAVHVLSSLVKRGKESVEQFRQGNRQDLVDKEEAELRVILSFLPEQLSEEQIRAQIRDVIQKLGARSPKDLGSVMKAAMEQLKGKADGRAVNQMARELLASQET